MSSPAQNPQSNDEEAPPYWCYNCNRQVSTEPNPFHPSEVVCKDCKHGFVELVVASPPTLRRATTRENLVDSSLNRQFLHVLRLIAQASHTDRRSQLQPENQEELPNGGGSAELLPWYTALEPIPPLANPTETNDFLRLELNGWDAVEEVDDDDDDDEDYVQQESAPPAPPATGNEVSGDGDGDGDNTGSVVGSRRRRRDIIRLRMEGVNRAARNLDWVEILQGLEDNTIELRVEMPESGETFAGNPEDYVDAAGYEALMQNFAENDNAGRGAPPASKSVVLGLPTVVIGEESPEKSMICAICKDVINVGEICRKLPCNHVYHGDCIVPWLGSRNSCPVCRFELPTDDPDYEELKKRGGGRRRRRAAVGTSEQ